MKNEKSLIQKMNEYKKLSKDYQAKKDYYMADYYLNRVEYIENKLELRKKEIVSERKKLKKFKEMNKESA
jgi:hypothetical protein